MTIFSTICSILFLFLLVRNINARIEYKEYASGSKGEVLYVMKDERRYLKVLRVLAVLLIVVTITLFILNITVYEKFLNTDGMQPIAMIAGLALLAFVPYSTHLWVMTRDGIFIYNSNAFFPWSQMITSGVQKRRKVTYVTVQIKKEKGEFLKQPFQFLAVKPEDAQRLSDLVREFVHANDKMKMLKRIKDERAENEAKKRKKTWY